MKKFAFLGVVAGTAAYLRDPERRSAVLGRATSLFRRGSEAVSETGQSVGAFGGEADGAIDDVTLARKVETEIFRAPDAPKGSVDVNVQEGVVQLRGEVERPELIDELVAKARSVQGVRDVENLLHTPGTEAPMHQ